MNAKRIRTVLVLVLLLTLLLTACGGEDDDKDDGPKNYKVGIILSSSIQVMVSNPLKIELEKLGYIEGQNIEYLIRVVETAEGLDAIIKELIAAKVNVIYTSGAGEAKVVLEHTNTIPVVFASGFDEIVDLLREPQAEGALVTGITLGDATTRRLDFLLKIDPTIKVIYAPYDPTNELSVAGYARLVEIAPKLNVEIIGVKVTGIEDCARARDEMPDNVDAIFLWTERFSVETWGEIAALAIERKIATSVPLARIELLDMLMGYGPDFEASGGQSARIVDRVLRGDPANEIPIEPSDPYLAINLAVADQIDLEITDTILAQATVIARGDNTSPSVVIKDEAQREGACNTTLNTPLGLTAGCVTVRCDALVNTAIITYEDKVDVDACDVPNTIGACSTAGSTTYFFEGNIDLLSSGCALSGGTWSLPNAPDDAGDDADVGDGAVDAEAGVDHDADAGDDAGAGDGADQ